MASDTIFSYGVNVERESAVEFVVASAYHCVAACFSSNETVNEFLVSKETVVLRRWERSKQKFGFIKRVDKG